jgi:hypothetical protein
MRTGNVYHSSSNDGPFTFFPAFRTITFQHDFHQTLYDIQIWLAFSADGSKAAAAGNETEFLQDPDTGDAGPALTPDHIRVYNDTCSDFYVQVVAEAAVCDGGVICPEPGAAAENEAGAAGASP